MPRAEHAQRLADPRQPPGCQCNLTFQPSNDLRRQQNRLKLSSRERERESFPPHSLQLSRGMFAMRGRAMHKRGRAGCWIGSSSPVGLARLSQEPRHFGRACFRQPGRVHARTSPRHHDSNGVSLRLSELLDDIYSPRLALRPLNDFDFGRSRSCYGSAIRSTCDSSPREEAIYTASRRLQLCRETTPVILQPGRSCHLVRCSSRGACDRRKILPFVINAIARPDQ